MPVFGIMDGELHELVEIRRRCSAGWPVQSPPRDLEMAREFDGAGRASDPLGVVLDLLAGEET